MDGTGIPLRTTEVNSRPLPREQLAGGATYPSVMNSRRAEDTRRTVSTPLLSSHLLSSFPTKHEAHDRTPLQRMGNNLPLPNDIRVARKLIELHRSERSELQTRLTTAQEILEEASEQLEAAESQGDKVTRSKGSLLSAEATRECAFETRRGLERRLAELEALLERHTSLIHPIRKLPEEILALIMKYTVEAVEYERRTMLHNPLAEVDRRASVELEASSPETCEDTPLSRHDFPPFPARRSNAPLPTPLVLAAVCTHWRNVAYEVPSMWRSITFKLSGQPHASRWDRVRSFVERGKGKLREDQSPVKIGISLVFTGWAEHGHPAASDSLRKVMRILANGMEGNDWSTETPSHSRRQSSADPTMNMLTDIPFDSPTLQVPSMTPRRPFSITRFELVFDSLCDHENALGASVNASLRWPTLCPKPIEVVLIARDSVYNTPPHLAEELLPTHYLVPPYAKTLIPWAESATLGNLAFFWPVKSKPDAYENLKSLKLVFTTYFDHLLRRPVDSDDLGFLQFLKMVPNLRELEIQLVTRPTLTSTPDATTTSLPVDHHTGEVLSARTQVSSPLEHLTISFDDLLHIIPLFTPDTTRTEVPLIHLPFLNHLTLSPKPNGIFTPPLTTSEPQLLRDFVTYTEAPLKRIELRRCDSVVSDFDAGLLRDRVLDALSGLTAPEVFEVWGDVNASALPRLFQTSSESNGRGSIEPGCSTPAQANGQCIVPKDNTPAPCDPSQPSADADHLATPQPDKMSTSSSSPTPSHKMRAKRRTGTSIVKDVLAKIFETIEPTSKRRSLALVATPEGTPRIAVNELSQQDDHDITSSAGPIPRASISSVGTARPFTRSLDVSVEGDGDVSVSSNTSDVISSARSIASRSNSTRTSRGIPVPASAIAAAVAAGLIGHHHPLQSIKRLIIHDAASVHVLARRLASEQNIQVIVYG
ncbi:hypothetical protein FRC18_006850 [Serendipita sp. 400]|nr:hypothetical protein FRC18_006850 [Serendipita sp. 400]